MKIPGLVAVHHPHWDGAFILQKHKYKKFIDANIGTWEKCNLDPNLFIAEQVHVKDTEIEDILLDGMPELFL